MSKIMKFTLKESHWKRGIKSSASHCALALALRDSGIPCINIYGYICITRTISITTPDDIFEIANMFDRGEEFPGEQELEFELTNQQYKQMKKSL